jgi:hypothetical protein
MKIALMSILTAGAIAVQAAPITNLVVNGSFEDNGTSIFSSNPNGWVLYNPINGWTSTGKVEVQENGLYAGSVAYDGTHWAELDSHNNHPGSVAIAQTLTTVVGMEYTLTFAFAGRPTYGVRQNVLDVGINGNMVRYQKGSAPNHLNWEVLSRTFIGTGSDVIYFADGGLINTQYNDTFGTLLDNVTVYGTQAVPEPATMGLFGLGLLGLVGFARKRSRAKA